MKSKIFGLQVPFKNLQGVRMKTMLDVMRQLEKELGAKEGLAIFEWYCKNYDVGVGDVAPSAIRYEVFGES